MKKQDLGKSVNDTKLEIEKRKGLCKTVPVKVSVQKDPDSFENWASRNLIEFSNGKCKSLCLGGLASSSSTSWVMTGQVVAMPIGTVPVSTSLSIRQLCLMFALSPNSANFILG